MGTIDAESGALDRFRAEVPDGQPIALINLLRYRERAALDGEQLTGRACYEGYVKALEPILMAVGGRPVWRGQVRTSLVGPLDERWDEAIIVAYPARSAFERMLGTPEYQAAVPLRTAALEDSRLLAAVAPQIIGRLAWSVYRVVSKLRR